MKGDKRTITALISVCIIALLLVSIAGCTDPQVPPQANSDANSTTSATSVTKAVSPTVAKKASASPTATPTTKPTPTPKPPTPTQNPPSPSGPFVGSKNSDVYHYPSCYHVNAIKPQNLVSFPTAAAAQAAGYRPCKDCRPPT